LLKIFMRNFKHRDTANTGYVGRRYRSKKIVTRLAPDRTTRLFALLFVIPEESGLIRI
jgi:hypothetical protein